jgi:hypothetical protein
MPQPLKVVLATEIVNQNDEAQKSKEDPLHVCYVSVLGAHKKEKSVYHSFIQPLLRFSL